MSHKILKHLFINTQILKFKPSLYYIRHNSVIASATVDYKTKSLLVVNFINGEELKFPTVFLQDNCTCSKCFQKSSSSRKRILRDLKLDKGVKNIKNNGNSIELTWEDGHESVFDEKWLKERRFTQENMEARRIVLNRSPILFGADFKMKSYNFNEILEKSDQLLCSLKSLCSEGVVLVKNAPRASGQLRQLVNKFGFIRTTHYGAEFTVKSEVNASNIAYTSNTLCVHTDLPYYSYPPSVQLIHCIKQYYNKSSNQNEEHKLEKIKYEEGESHLVDGFLVASQMKKMFPEHYETLCTESLEFRDIGEDFIKFHKVHHSPTFVLSKNGNLERIVYSNQQLSSFLPLPLEKVYKVYEALKIFTDLCYAPHNLLRFKLAEGDILIFDNWRVLHGRQGFDSTKSERHLEGCYVDWDEIHSTIRVLENDS